MNILTYTWEKGVNAKELHEAIGGSEGGFVTAILIESNGEGDPMQHGLASDSAIVRLGRNLEEYMNNISEWIPLNVFEQLLISEDDVNYRMLLENGRPNKSLFMEDKEYEGGVEEIQICISNCDFPSVKGNKIKRFCIPKEIKRKFEIAREQSSVTSTIEKWIGKKPDEPKQEAVAEQIAKSAPKVEVTITPDNSTYERTVAVIRDKMEYEKEITTESKFMDDIGCDSLDCVELVMALEDEFEIEIFDDEVINKENMTVGNAVEIIDRKIREKTSSK